MKEFIKGLFMENSKISMMRMLSLICVLTAAGIAFYCVIKGTNIDAASTMVGLFLGAGIGGKAIQKVTENRNGQ